jgi:hypothetical protein
MTSEEKTIRREKAAKIFATVLGPDWRILVAQALELNRAQVRRYFTPPKGRDDAPPVSVLACAEFLQSTPRSAWPDRWKG